MDAMNFPISELSKIDSKLDQIISDFPGNANVLKYATQLKKMIEEYKKKQIYINPGLRAEVGAMFNVFKPVAKETAVSLTESAKSNCNGCLFHSDNCMINIFFVLFKSVEMQKFIDFKDLRPNMRMVF